MPTYEYRCRDCATEFEVRQSFADDPLTDCVDESCDGTVAKVFRGVGISFKGDGFYKNDHGSSSTSRARASSSDSRTSGSSEGGSSGSSDASSNGSSSETKTPAASTPSAD